MTRPSPNLAFAVATALVFSACSPNQEDTLLLLEKSANEAWKSKDTEFWNTFLSDRFVGYGASGRLDKAAAEKEFSGADCTINSYAMSEEQLTRLDADVALLTYKSTVDGTCGGQKVPTESIAVSIFVREANNWKGAFHAEAPIVDPRTVSASPADSKTPPAATNLDANTERFLTAEKGIWEAWKDADRTRIEALLTPEVSFVNIFGTRFLKKADAVKDWTGHGCKVKSVSVTNPVATLLSPNVTVLTFNGAADGTCFGQKIGPIWGTSIYIKHGSDWKWTFGINLPAK